MFNLAIRSRNKHGGGPPKTQIWNYLPQLRQARFRSTAERLAPLPVLRDPLESVRQFAYPTIAFNFRYSRSPALLHGKLLPSLRNASNTIALNRA